MLNHDVRERCTSCLTGFTVYYEKGKPHATSIPAEKLEGLWFCEECIQKLHLKQKGVAKSYVEKTKQM